MLQPCKECGINYQLQLVFSQGFLVAINQYVGICPVCGDFQSAGELAAELRRVQALQVPTKSLDSMVGFLYVTTKSQVMTGQVWKICQLLNTQVFFLEWFGANVNRHRVHGHAWR